MSNHYGSQKSCIPCEHRKIEWDKNGSEAPDFCNWNCEKGGFLIERGDIYEEFEHGRKVHKNCPLNSSTKTLQFKRTLEHSFN